MTTDPQTCPGLIARLKENGSLSFLFTTGGLLAVGLLASGFAIIEEGHVGIVKRWGKAVAQLDPGFHFKTPVAETIEEIEVRQRRNVEDLRAATENQLPITASVSINWTVNRESAMDLFIAYGGLDRFETRILDPKLRSAAKAALSGFPADRLIRNRQDAVAAIMANMTAELEGFPVTVNSLQIETIAGVALWTPPDIVAGAVRSSGDDECAGVVRRYLEQGQSLPPDTWVR